MRHLDQGLTGWRATKVATSRGSLHGVVERKVAMLSSSRGALHRVGLVVALLIFGVAPARADEGRVEPGRMVERVFTNEAGTRSYLLYVPSGGASGLPLMVWLHGCGQPGTMVAGHALARVAEERGFVLAYPLQDRAANAQNCWNWLDPSHRHRGTGEAAIIAGITTTLERELHLDPAASTSAVTRRAAP